MQKFNLAKRWFDMEQQSSCSSPDSIIYLSSSSDKGQYEGWDSDWSSETEDMIKGIEQEVSSSPILIVGWIMTTGSMEVEMTAGPSTSRANTAGTSKLDHKNFNKKLCYAPPREALKTDRDVQNNLACSRFPYVSTSH